MGLQDTGQGGGAGKFMGQPVQEKQVYMCFVAFLDGVVVVQNE